MDPTRLSSFDLASFDPAASPPPRRRAQPPGATARKPVPASALVAPAAPAPDTTELREAVALLASQLGEAQAANAALAKRLDEHIDEPRRKAEQAAILEYLIASRF